MTKEINHIEFLRELEPVVATEYDRHVSENKPWNPHEWIKWSEGKDYALLGGIDWDPTQSTLRPAAQKALILNLLTEDNLPGYTGALKHAFRDDEAYGNPDDSDNSWLRWVGRWTAEEARHAVAMRDFLVVSRSADPIELETARMPHMTAGFESRKSPLEATAYVTMQELATAVSHRKTGRMITEDGYQPGGRLMGRIAADEMGHYKFYQNLGAEMFKRLPNLMMQAAAKEFIFFNMPGADTIPNFKENAKVIAEAGIYNVPIHVSDVLQPVLEGWNVLNRTDVDGDGAQAQDFLGQYWEAAQEKAKKKAAEIADKNSKEQV